MGFKKMMHTQEYYLATKQNEFVSFIKWKKKLELEVIILRNNSDSERNGSHVLLLLFSQNWKMINKKNINQSSEKKGAHGR